MKCWDIAGKRSIEGRRYTRGCDVIIFWSDSHAIESIRWRGRSSHRLLEDRELATTPCLVVEQNRPGAPRHGRAIDRGPEPRLRHGEPLDRDSHRALKSNVPGPPCHQAGERSSSPSSARPCVAATWRSETVPRRRRRRATPDSPGGLRRDPRPYDEYRHRREDSVPVASGRAPRDPGPAALSDAQAQRPAARRRRGAAE